MQKPFGIQHVSKLPITGACLHLYKINKRGILAIGFYKRLLHDRFSVFCLTTVNQTAPAQFQRAIADTGVNWSMAAAMKPGEAPAQSNTVIAGPRVNWSITAAMKPGQAPAQSDTVIAGPGIN